LFVIEGDVALNQNTPLKKRDAARITDVTELTIETAAGAFLVLIDLP